MTRVPACYGHYVLLGIDGQRHEQREFATWDAAYRELLRVMDELCEIGWIIAYSPRLPYTLIARAGEVRVIAQLVTIGRN